MDSLPKPKPKPAEESTEATDCCGSSAETYYGTCAVCRQTAEYLVKTPQMMMIRSYYYCLKKEGKDDISHWHWHWLIFISSAQIRLFYDDDGDGEGRREHGWDEIEMMEPDTGDGDGNATGELKKWKK